jgi:hypothetical protein
MALWHFQDGQKPQGLARAEVLQDGQQKYSLVFLK